jgi:hypothetical protein
MLPDVERDETFDGGEGVEAVEEQPVVFEGAPPGLDHRIGEGDFDQSEDAAETSEAQEYIDVAVDVLDARIGNDGCGISTEVDSGPGSGENRAGRLGLELRRRRSRAAAAVIELVGELMMLAENPEKRVIELRRHWAAAGSAVR